MPTPDPSAIPIMVWIGDAGVDFSAVADIFRFGLDLIVFCLALIGGLLAWRR